MTGFKFQRQSSSAAPFPTPPTISYTCQHSPFFQRYWAAIVSLGRCGPMEWNQSSPSSHAGTVTRGSCFQVLSWVEVTPIHPPGSKHDQSYLTYLWSQLKVIDMLNNHERRLAAQLLLYKTALNGPAPRVQSPMLRLVQWGHPTYIFLQHIVSFCSSRFSHPPPGFVVSFPVRLRHFSLHLFLGRSYFYAITSSAFKKFQLLNFVV